MARPVVHDEVRGLDSGLLQEFYSEVFGWERNEGLSIGDYAVAEIGAGNLTVGIGPVPDWSARSAKFYIQVDDIDETLTRIEAAGGRAVMPRTVAWPSWSMSPNEAAPSTAWRRVPSDPRSGQ